MIMEASVGPQPWGPDWMPITLKGPHKGVLFCMPKLNARQLTCSGTMIEPSAMSPSPETVVLTLGPAQKVTLDLGKGMVNARKVSNNKIQLKFRTKDFEGEYFHYTGDLFFIYKSGHLMKLTCQKL